jgi:hypothetical protein
MSFLYIVAMVPSAAGAFFAGVAIRNVVKGSASRRWPRVEGRVLRSFVRVDRFDEGEAFSPQVEYEYVVGGFRIGECVFAAGREGAGTGSGRSK